MSWQWALIVGLAATPALIAGQSAACAAGIGLGFDPRVYLPVIAAVGFVQGLVVAGLAGASGQIAWLERRLARVRTPRAMAWVDRWGPWGGLVLGTAALGQEPILLALRWMGIRMRRILVPLAVSNVAFTLVYYAIVKFGWDQVMGLG